MNEEEYSIIWRRLDTPGHEAVHVYCDEDGWYLDGSTVFLHEGNPCRIEYLVECDLDWRTVAAAVDGWVGDELIDYEIEVKPGEIWYRNGENVSAVKGCVDIDLNFSPVTNLLPIRRMDLKIGESEKTRAAWLRFPSFSLEPLEQIYTRLDETTVRYESDGGRFARDLRVSEAGLVLQYPDFWSAEPGLL